MATIRLRGMEIPLEAKWYNPRYQAGVRHCFAVLAGPVTNSPPDVFDYEGVSLFVESDMWHIAAALGAMSVLEREQHGWFDLFSRALMDHPSDSRPEPSAMAAIPRVHITGLAPLDADHQSLRLKIEALREYCRRDVRVSEAIPAIHRVIQDTRHHYNQEEQMMAESRYPLVEMHIREHTDAARQMLTAMRNLIDGNADLVGTVATLCECEDFHIESSDQTYADYVLSQPQRR